MKAATQVWIATAHLQHVGGDDRDFEKREILAEVQRQGWTGVSPGTIDKHISGHCVAGDMPSPSRLRMLTRTAKGRFRLYREGDAVHLGASPGRLARSRPRSRRMVLPLGLVRADLRQVARGR